MSQTNPATVAINPLSDDEAALWRLAREISTTILSGLPWVLIGGVMVRLIEAEHGVIPRYATVDLDAVLDLKVLSNATEEAASRLVASGFDPTACAGEIVYRFTRGHDIVDVLAPDHLGRRTTRLTVPPNNTIEVDGGRQALDRLRMLKLDAGEGAFLLPVPDLRGALVVKSRALENATDQLEQRKHERDVCRLLVLIADPIGLKQQMRRRELRYLQRHAALTDPANQAWRGIANASDGAAALALLTAS